MSRTTSDPGYAGTGRLIEVSRWSAIATEDPTVEVVEVCRNSHTARVCRRDVGDYAGAVLRQRAEVVMMSDEHATLTQAWQDNRTIQKSAVVRLFAATNSALYVTLMERHLDFGARLANPSWPSASNGI